VEITTVHVSQRSRLGRTLIRHDELGVPRLGNVAAYDDVLACLHAALRQCGVTLLEAPAGGSSGHNALHGRAELPDTDSKLFVRSDGARATGIERQYGQDALLATVRASRPRAGWAYERFTRQGPLAFLPHPDGADLYGVVWCNPPARAAHLQALDDAAFEASLGEAFGDRLGDLHVLGPRHVFPLSMHAGPSLLGQRAIAIGNAAQTLHPVAGQGLNLGLRDAAQLAIALGPWLAQPDSDPTHLLADFARRRRPDRLLTGGVTDFLPRIFATGNPLVEHAGGLALLALDVLPGLRRPLARHLLQGLRT
jgi:2-octaprenyl-6-methoxyphenol hydroxylase